MDKNPGKGLNIGNIGGKSLPFRRNTLFPDPDNFNGSNSNDNIAGFFCKLSCRFIKRFNVFLKSGKKDNDYVNNYCARIITVFFTNIFINSV